MISCLQNQYDELAFYTLSLQDKEFIHQHIADAQTAQTADENTKPIGIIFSLAGLYLYIEEYYTGKQVQQFHVLMSKNKKVWPHIILPAARGQITAADVVKAAPGKDRNRMIYNWCVSVWQAYQQSHEVISDIIETQRKESCHS